MNNPDFNTARLLEAIEVVDTTCSTKTDELPWANATIPKSYKLSEEGLYATSKEPHTKICNPVWVAANTETPSGDECGILVSWLDRKGRFHERAIPMGRLYEHGNDLISEFANSGLVIVPGQEANFKKALASFSPLLTLQPAHKIGWHETPDGLAYVLPSRTLSTSETRRIIYQPEQSSRTAHVMSQSGRLEQWISNVAEKVADEPYLLFFLMTAFAGPLLRPANMDSFLLHVYQVTSRGKTTCAQIAASVWGNGSDPGRDADNAYSRSWNTTANAAESLACDHNDNVLILDEIGKAEPKEVAKLTYNLTGGQGKERMNQSGDRRKARSWRALCISTGEKSIQDTIKTVRQVKGGELIRCIDIPVSSTLILNQENPGQFADELKLACGRYFGFAGPEFVSGLLQHYTQEELEEALELFISDCLERITPKNAAPEVARLAKRFALIEAAGKIAMAVLRLPYNSSQIERSIDLVAASVLANVSENTDGKRIIKHLQDFILANKAYIPNGDSDAASSYSVIKGYKYKGLYLFNSTQLAEATGEATVRLAAQALNEDSLLERNNGKNLTSKFTVPAVSQTRRLSLYAVRESILEFEALKDVTKAA